MKGTSVRMIWVTALTLCFAVYPDSLGRGGRGGGGARVSGGRAISGPAGGRSVGARTTSSVVGPRGGMAQGVSGGGAATGPRGGSIEYKGGAVGGTGPRGVTGGKAVGGIQVTTPGGREVTKVGTAGGVRGPGGAAVGGKKSVGVGVGPGGAVVGGSKSGIAVGPNGVVAGGSRGIAGVGPGGAVVGGSRGVAAAGRYGTYHRSTAALRTQGTYVRRSFSHYNCFNRNWYARYPGAWFAAGWASGAVWRAATWDNVYPYCGYAAEPYYYDYGATVVYEGDTVYVDGAKAATAEEYATQATKIADTGRSAEPPENEEWKPLGVFAMVRGDEESSDKIFQLAISKDGVIRGNYYDAIADTTYNVFGSVDKKTQRAAWSIGEKKDVVFEAGIANLTKDETPVLVHYGKDNTQQFTLVRIEEPKNQPAQPQ